MIIQRISLINFLSYHGMPDESGKATSVDVDFGESALWLIYGLNGTGKSSIFDAITFALYKKHRGSHTSNNSFSYLVSDNENYSRVQVEIILSGHRFLIERSIILDKKRNAKITGLVHKWIENNWIAIPRTTGNVEEWVEKNIHMSYETFVSAVLLRQGEADVFLKAKPKERKTRLLEVLNLDFYKKLGDLASKKKENIRKQIKQLDIKITSLNKISDDDVQSQAVLITQIEQKLVKIRSLLSEKERERDNAQRAFNIHKDISVYEKELEKALALIQREPEITARFKRFRELEIDIPSIQNILSIQDDIEKEASAIVETQTTIEYYQGSLDRITDEMIKSKLELEKADIKRRGLRDDFNQVDQQRTSLKIVADQIASMVRIESQIAQATARLAPYHDILKSSTELDAQRERLRNLKLALPILKNLLEAKDRLIILQSEKGNFEQELVSLLQQLDESNFNLQKEEDGIEKLRNRKQELDEETQNLSLQDNELSRKVGTREGIAEKEECPICGSHLDSDEAHSRIQTEISSWKHELIAIKKKLDDLNIEREKNNKTLVIVTAEREKIKGNYSSVEIKKAVCKSKIDNHEEKIIESQNRINTLSTESGEWIAQLDQVDTLSQEILHLEQNQTKWAQLELARKEQTKSEAEIQARQADLNELPTLDEAQRTKSKILYNEISAKFIELQKFLQEAENEHQVLDKKLSNLANQNVSVSKDISYRQEDIDQTKLRKTKADEQLLRRLDQLPLRLKSLQIIFDRKILSRFEEEKSSLANAEQEETDLGIAKNVVSRLEGQIGALKDQLDTIPVEHRRLVNEVQIEYQSARGEEQKMQADLNANNEKLGQMNAEQKEYKEQSLILEGMQTQFKYYEKLSDSFGQYGLQAQIIQKAQEEIKNAANISLDHLSNGIWKIELVGNDDELEILAQDTSQAGPPRQFEYLSGGEKFRVAISLAVAIGQSISGGRTVDTLIIDEGFGSLDKFNRDNLVSELSRLSTDVLNGGRVVIVSHEEDICEKFAHKLRVCKDENGMVSIERDAG